VVTDAERDDFVARTRKDEPTFTIRPPGRRPVYYVARPSLSHQATLAADLDLPERRRPVAFELFVPVYGADDPGDNAASRRKSFLGWATGQFRAADFLEAALDTSLPTTGVELHDREVGADSLVSSWPPGFRAVGPDVREETAVSILLGALLWLLAQVGALYREVGRLARTDALTGVANRRAWEEEFSRELARAGRSGQPLCVALLDLDHFKAYNDQHGHPAGDRLLKEATAAWQGKAAQDRPAGPLRRGGVRRAAARLRAGQRHGDRRAAADRPARGHLLARGGRLGRPRGCGRAARPGRPGPVRRQAGRPEPELRRPSRRRAIARVDRIGHGQGVWGRGHPSGRIASGGPPPEMENMAKNSSSPTTWAARAVGSSEASATPTAQKTAVARAKPVATAEAPPAPGRRPGGRARRSARWRRSSRPRRRARSSRPG
jgi:Diguanylate cyclase, GGDEF domain/CHASE domain